MTKRTRPLAVLKTPAAFRLWLEGKPGGEKVGVTDATCDCPLARFLQERLSEEVSVWPAATDARMVICADVVRDYPLPDWACRFARRLDEGMRARARVSARMALLVLAEVQAGDGSG